MAFDKVIVTGGSGLLGRYMVRELQAHGHGVTVFDLKPPEAGVPYVQGDIMDLPAVEKALAGHDAVIHLGGLDLAIKAPPQEFMRVNVIGTWHVLQAAEKAGIRHAAIASSVAATGLGEMRTDWPPQYLPVDVAHPCRPVHPYSLSKKTIEEAALTFVRRGVMRVICIRPLLVTFDFTIKNVIEREKEGFRWLYYYVTPEDTARCFRLALEAEDLAYDTIFASAADNASLIPTLDVMRRNRILPFPEIRAPALYRKNPNASPFDIEHGKRAIGFEPSSSWKSLIASVKS